MSYDDGNDLLFGNAAPAAAFDPGVKVRGMVTDFGKNHRREFDGKTRQQGKPLYWQEDATQSTDVTDRPVLDPVMTVQTSFRAWEALPEDRNNLGTDDGLRRLFLSGRSKKSAYFAESTLQAVREAVVAAGARKVSPGDYVELECVGIGKPSARGINGAKRFTATYWLASNPPEWAAEVESDEPGEDPLDDENPFD